MSDISYELAKKLWDAGYPFKRRDSKMSVMCLCTKDVCDGMFGREFRFDGNLYPEPTLEEIIEECGRNFDSLNIVRDGYSALWLATDEPTSYEGKTPTEAVANLYLALKRNPAQ